MLRFSLAILTALAIAVVGSIAWDAGQHLGGVQAKASSESDFDSAGRLNGSTTWCRYGLA
jgi:hypothetical protein